MAEHSAEISKVVSEIRELIRLMAEPAIAERDRKLRSELRRIVGGSTLKANSVLLMDGSRPQKDIRRETKINQGDLSTLVKRLRESKLVEGDGKQPLVIISIPANCFESETTDERG